MPLEDEIIEQFLTTLFAKLSYSVEDFISNLYNKNERSNKE